MYQGPLPKGIFSAQWIPTDAAGRVNRASLASHLAFEKRAGIHGVLALGSTGEFPHFNVDERKELLALIAELAAPLTMLANITDIRPRVAIELGRCAKSLGYAAVSLMPPTFYPVSQADMLAYFLHVADAVDLPVVLYNFPELTGKRIDVPTIAAFADRAPMCAIKQSGAEFEYHKDLIALGREKRFVVLSGADTRLPEVFALGGAGCTGGLVNIVPELMVHIYGVCAERVPGDATRAAERMKEFGRVLDLLTFPLNVAAALEGRGIDPGVPKTIVSAESRDRYEEIVRACRALFAQWELAPATKAA